MKSSAFAFALAFALALLVFGCLVPVSSGPEAPAVPAPVAVPQPPAPPSQVPTPEENASAAPAPEPNVTSDSCQVEFQKDDVSNLFYVMVKTDSQKEVSVTCPNGQAGVRQNGLFFCSQLDVENAAVAYLDNVKCGEAQFSQSALSSKPAGKQKCNIYLSSSRITAGQSAVVTVKAYVPETSTLTFSCGSSEVSQSASGMVDAAKVCKYDSPGTYEIVANLNGEECARTYLTAFASARECLVYSTDRYLEGGYYVYKAKLSARGYSTNDKISYRCYVGTQEVPLSTFQNPTDFETEIECRSNSGPLSSDIKVSVAGESCGTIPVGG